MCSDIADLSRDEAKRILRRLELEAYSAIVSAFRAQGELGREKKKLLNDLGIHLCISTERHRAEVRRAYSDDRLSAISQSVYGPGSCAEWAAEGRRTVPLMPRLVPQTVLTATATAAANTAAASNAKLPASSASAIKVPASSHSSANSSPGGSTTSSASSSSQQSATKSAATTYSQQASGSQASDAENESDGKMKKRRRLSTSLAKPVPRIITPSAIAKPVAKTASVSTMTKVGKPIAQATAPAKPAMKGTLSASASQVKLLTKTVAITPTLCQAKTVLTYKTVQTPSSSPVKVQTVMTSAAPKVQIKPALPSSSPSKSVLVPKPHGTAGVVPKPIAASPGISKAVGSSSSPAAIKLGITTSQLAARQRPKPTRFKALPGTVKFKSVTPVTMGTSSVVTMVTPSPGTQASSGGSITSSSVSTSQPYFKVIQVPVTGVVGSSKPVVMNTGLAKTVMPSVAAGTAVSRLPQASSTATVAGQSVLKVPISIAPATVPQSPVATCVASTAKSVVMTTVVGGTKRVVLSVPAYSLAQTKPIVTTTLTAAASHTGSGVILPVPGTRSAAAMIGADSLSQSGSRGQDLSSTLGLEAVPLSLTQGSTQIMPKHVASTLTTQVRSRPLPAILPAPPKPAVTVSGQSGSASPAAGTVRKLPQILPAPAKNVTVIQPVLLPVVPVTASAGQLGTSLPLVLTSAVPSTVVSTSDGTSVQSTAFPTSASSLVQEPATTVDQEITMVLGTTETPCSVGPSGEVLGHQESVHTPKKQPRTDAQPSLSTVAVELTLTEGEPNTSSEDDSLLLCSETLDISSAVREASPTKPFLSKEAPTECNTASDAFENLLSSPTEQTLLKPNEESSDKAVDKVDMQAAQCDISVGVDNAVKTGEMITDVSSSEVTSLQNVLLQEPVDYSATHLEDTAQKRQNVFGDSNVATKDCDSSSSSSVVDSENLKDQESKTLGLDLGEQEIQTAPISALLHKSIHHTSEESFEQSTNIPTIADLGESVEGKSDENTSFKQTGMQEHCAVGVAKKEESAYGTANVNETVVNKTLVSDKEAEQISESPSVIVEKLSDVSSYSYCTSELLQPLNASDKPCQQHPKEYEDLPTACSLTGKVMSRHEGGIGHTPLGHASQEEGHYSESSSEHSTGELIIESEMCTSLGEHGSQELSSQDVNVDILSIGSASSSNDSMDKEMTDKERKALEAIANVRTSGRKRKAPLALDVSPPRPGAGWIRSAVRECAVIAVREDGRAILEQLRGSCVQYSECGFHVTRPNQGLSLGRKKSLETRLPARRLLYTRKLVDASDAPGYYKIIKTPMDFGTIRTKLESGQYQDYTDFYADMLLVKTNCQKYNPPGHEVRQDCDEVFRFFELEYAKMLERWEKCHTISVFPAKKVKAIQPKTDSVTK